MMPPLKRIAVNLLRLFAISLLLVVTAWILITLAYCIPIETIESGYSQSVSILQSEGQYDPSRIASKFDGFTEAVMLNIISNSFDPNTSPFIVSLNSAWNTYEQGSQIDALATSINDDANSNYIRYWHGYVTVIKPLLMFLNIAQIRAVFQTALIVLTIVSAVSLYRRMQGAGLVLSMAMVLSLSIFGCYDASTCLPFFFSFAIAIASTIWASATPLTKASTFFGFVIIGGATVYFDFLDNPILTLGIPLGVIITRTAYEKGNASTKSLIKSTASLFLACCIGWLYGYVMLWAAKWALATIVTSTNAIDNAILAISYRAGFEQEELSRANAIACNLTWLGPIRTLTFSILPIALTAILIANIAVLILNRKPITHMLAWLATIILTTCALGSLPYIWYILVANHSTIHSFFTYRNQAITLYAMLLLTTITTATLLESAKQEKPHLPSYRRLTKTPRKKMENQQQG